MTNLAKDADNYILPDIEHAQPVAAQVGGLDRFGMKNTTFSMNLRVRKLVRPARKFVPVVQLFTLRIIGDMEVLMG